MRTRPSALIVAASVLAAGLLAWHYRPRGGAAEPRPLGAASEPAVRLARWARVVREAPPGKRAAAVRESFHPSIPETQQEMWAEPVARDLAGAEGDAPLSVLAAGRETLKATWACRPEEGGAARATLLFRLGPDDRLWLLGPVP